MTTTKHLLHPFYLVICCMCLISLRTTDCCAQLSIDLETGAAAFGYNDVRIPGNTGTAFSISRELNSDPVVFFRGRLQYQIGKRHTILALYAPLTIKSRGTFMRDIDFQNERFGAGSTVDCSWKFNSYRLSYQYHVVAREKFILALGITGKIRDARIALSSTNTHAEKTNVGFVPLIRFYMDWNLYNTLHLVLDGDALVGTQGRAEDILLGFQYAPTPKLRIKAGYRILEGGADNKEVYNFSLVHYATIGASYRFW